MTDDIVPRRNEPTAPPTSVPPRTPTRGPATLRRWGAVVGILLVVSLVAASGVWATNVQRHSNLSTPQGGSVGQTFSPTDAAALAWASSFQGGGWGVLGASGFAIPPALAPSGSVNSSAFLLLNGGGSCNYTSLVPAGRTFSLPATPGNRSAGSGTYWRIDLVNGANGVLSLLELGGSVQPLAVGTCSGNFSEFFQFQNLPTSVVDSSVAANAVWGAGGSAFVAAHPGYVAEFAVSAGYTSVQNRSSTPPEWDVLYTDCTNATSATSAPQFSATVNAVSGSVLTATTGTGYCGFSW